MADPVGQYKYQSGKDTSPAALYARQTRVQRMKDAIEKLKTKLTEMETEDGNVH